MNFRGKEKLSSDDLEWLSRALALWRLKAALAKGKPGSWILACFEMPPKKGTKGVSIFYCDEWEPVQVGTGFFGKNTIYWAKRQISKRTFTTRIP